MRSLRWVSVCALSVAACGGDFTNPKTVTPGGTDAGAKEESIAPQVHFQLWKAGKKIGTEMWAEKALADGRSEVTVHSEIEAGPSKIVSTGTVTYTAAQKPEGAQFKVLVGDTPVQLELKQGDKGLTLVSEAKGKPAETLNETKKSDLFIAEPMIAGYAGICAPSVKVGGSLAVFPGNDITVTSVKDVALSDTKTGRVVILDQAGQVRIEVGCIGSSLAVVRIPISSGFQAVREGEEKLAEKIAELGVREKPKVPDALVESDRAVTVPAQGTDAAVELSCSFLAPKDGGPFPAVVFVTGSGPQDRDEDTVGPSGLRLSLFKVIAIELAKKGIASLRCDDRGIGKSTGNFSAGTLATFTRDAQAMLASLRKDPKVDAKKTGLVGHSEGGYIGPMIAAKDPVLKFLVLLAAPATPLQDIILTQGEEALTKSGLAADDKKREVEKLKAVLSAIRDGKKLPESLDPLEAKAMESQRVWLQSHFKNDPEKALRAMPKTIPVLVAQGEQDTQISRDDAKKIEKLLSGNKKLTVTVYPGLNHLFSKTRTGTMADYSDPDAKIDPTFLTALTDFVNQYTK